MACVAVFSSFVNFRIHIVQFEINIVFILTSIQFRFCTTRVGFCYWLIPYGIILSMYVIICSKWILKIIICIKYPNKTETCSLHKSSHPHSNPERFRTLSVKLRFKIDCYHIIYYYYAELSCLCCWIDTYVFDFSLVDNFMRKSKY